LKGEGRSSVYFFQNSTIISEICFQKCSCLALYLYAGEGHFYEAGIHTIKKTCLILFDLITTIYWNLESVGFVFDGLRIWPQKKEKGKGEGKVFDISRELAAPEMMLRAGKFQVCKPKRILPVVHKEKNHINWI